MYFIFIDGGGYLARSVTLRPPTLGRKSIFSYSTTAFIKLPKMRVLLDTIAGWISQLSRGVKAQALIRPAGKKKLIAWVILHDPLAQDSGKTIPLTTTGSVSTGKTRTKTKKKQAVSYIVNACA